MSWLCDFARSCRHYSVSSPIRGIIGTIFGAAAIFRFVCPLIWKPFFLLSISLFSLTLSGVKLRIRQRAYVRVQSTERRLLFSSHRCWQMTRYIISWQKRETSNFGVANSCRDLAPYDRSDACTRTFYKMFEPWNSEISHVFTVTLARERKSRPRNVDT